MFALFEAIKKGQMRAVVVNSGKVNPLSNDPIFNVLASYAMGRADGDPSTGIGPQQTGGVPQVTSFGLDPDGEALSFAGSLPASPGAMMQPSCPLGTSSCTSDALSISCRDGASKVLTMARGSTVA